MPFTRVNFKRVNIVLESSNLDRRSSQSSSLDPMSMKEIALVDHPGAKDPAHSSEYYSVYKPKCSKNFNLINDLLLGFFFFFFFFTPFLI